MLKQRLATHRHGTSSEMHLDELMALLIPLYLTLEKFYTSCLQFTMDMRTGRCDMIKH